MVGVTPESVAGGPAATVQDAAKHTAFVRAVAEVRVSMGQRDLAASKRALQTAAANAQSEADHGELQRLQALQDHLEQFWGGIREAVAAMQPVDEIVLSESNRVAVIEASRDELLVQIYGRPERYRIVALPIALVKALVDQSFASTPGSKVIVATFLAMDREGDRGRARQLFEEASRAGESLGRDLLPELDVPLPDIRGGAGSTVHGLGQ